MKYLSLFSGIEAATVAWRPLGWECVGLSEIEPFPCSLLKHYYPDVKNYGDINDYEKWDIAPGSVDLICGGSPCQDFSIAGARAGIHGTRSGLFWKYLGVLERLRPRYFVWENVPGTISSCGGADYRAIVSAFAECGYGVAARVLDVQYVSVDGYVRAIPQRRNRLFVVGYIGDWRRAAAVLLEPQSMCGNTPPRREAGQRVAPTIGSRTKGGGGLGTDVDLDGGLIPETASTISNRDHKGISCGRDGLSGTPLIECFQNTGQGYWNEGDSAATIKNPAGSGVYESNVAISQYGDIADSITARGDSSPCADRGMNIVAECAPTMQTEGHCKTHSDIGNIGDALVAIPIHDKATRHAGKRGPNHDGAGNGLGIGQDEDPAPTIGAHDIHAVAQQVQWASGGGQILNDTAQAIRSNAEHNYQFVFENHAQDSRIKEIDCSPLINAKAGTGGNNLPLVQCKMVVRRFTPIEVERLFGFPDNWTKPLLRTKKQPSDSARYKALGNSMGVNVMRWIGRRIQLVEEIKSK